MAKIERIHAREILDSRGNPTVEVDLWADEFFGRASVPSGASTGTYEALELHDGGKRYGGKGVLKAVDNVNKKIAHVMKGMNVLNQKALDKKMIHLDGTPNKSKLGANAILGVSLAAAKAAACSEGRPLYEYINGLWAEKPPKKYLLPVPFCNVVNAGKHGGSRIELQEFMIVPYGAKSFSDAIRMASEAYYQLQKILVRSYGPSLRNVGYEGGFSGPIDHAADVLDALCTAVESAGYSLKKDFGIALDSAASEFYEHGLYSLEGSKFTNEEMIGFYSDLTKAYPIISLEDPLAEEDWEGFVALTKMIGGRVQIVGDDLFCTKPERLKIGIARGACNAMILKVNQIGTLSESIEAANLCFRNGYRVIVSHRSGETEDTTIADLAVGLNCGQIKTGAPSRGERTAKYNQLLRIEESLEGKTEFGGKIFVKKK
jgi:enolase